MYKCPFYSLQAHTITSTPSIGSNSPLKGIGELPRSELLLILMKESTTTAGLGARSLITRVEKVEDLAVVASRSEMVTGGISRARQQRLATSEQHRRPIERELSDVNKSADAFIQRFRQQLEIQRMQSLENYENMLARGT